jgi:hypothetical protein
VNVMATEHSMVIRSATEKDLDRVLEIDRLSFPAPWTHHCFKLVLKDIFFVIEQKVLVIAWGRATVTNYNKSKRGLKQTLKSS